MHAEAFKVSYTKRSGEVVILRDVFENIIKWVTKFKEVGDMAVQCDPGHTVLPRAGVRLFAAGSYE
jgi:hypothetical protein